MRFSKRNLVLTSAALIAIPAMAQAPLDHRELAADQQIIHALNRLTFGARPGDVQKVRSTGLDKWVDLQLHPERIDDSSLQKFLDLYSVMKQDQNNLLREFNQGQRERRLAKREAGDSGMRQARRMDPDLQQIAQNRRRMMGELQSSRVAHAVAGNRQLEEVMTDFWLNHFNVFAQKGAPEPYYLAEYERDVIRPHSLGKFRDLLESVAKSPAMLFYLDNARSMADTTRPRLASINRNPRRLLRADPDMRQRLNQLRNGGLNENYGRELLELHTLGVDGGYSQQDVINVARALTGWTIRPPAAGGGFIFRPEMHDAGEKIVLGHKLKANRGIEDGEDVLDIVSRHPSTAKYIAAKLARRFISDNPPQAVVDRAAQVFMKSDGDIREVVRAIITSNEFYSRQAFRSKVKSPFEVVVSAMRAMNAAPDSTPRTAQMIAYLGQPIYGHQAPNGWPETGDAWMNTGAILNRINFGMAAAANRIPGANVRSIPGIDSLGTASRQKQVDAVVSVLLGGSVSPDTRAVLMSGENPLLANAKPAEDTTTQTMDAGDPGDMQLRPRANPFGRQNGAPLQLTGVAQVVGLALGSPEFQRR
ncbi:MAG TPA: DUF1800 domain-containing protein [Gemmatimonadaceae bacterium]|nr:DUF1800 domain-containing protein [Gemmatimonadaceae bacterium]